ncbi:MAG: class I SAM-dependent methyltransferase [Solirubrobacterales bacterium]
MADARHHWGWADLHGWEVLRPLLDSGGFLPWSEGSMSPAGLATVATEISLAERRTILELGSGVSTIVLARLARELGGRIWAVEHHPGWAGWVRRALERDGLSDIATVIDAPLAPHPAALEGAPWYSPQALQQAPAEGIELLLVDGPPGYGEGMERSRYPALPVLGDRLAPGALVVLDDAQRPGEAEILSAWEEAEGFAFDRRPAERIAIGRRMTPAA